MTTIGDIGQDDQTAEQPSIGSPTAKTTWHWFDFICPFCYVARSRNEILSRSGLVIVEVPFQAQPEIPAGGVTVGLRSGEKYDRLEREAREAGLPLRWPPRLPNSRYALTVAEWVRRHHSEGFTTLYHQLFLSHFSLGEDIGDVALVNSYAEQAGADLDLVKNAISDGSADAAAPLQ
jgi:predicted DsbA family dithiol-disulfide isomerase